MSDIVERLRTSWAVEAQIDLHNEAADEIERLRTEYPYSEVDLEMAIEGEVRDLRAEINRLRAEIERLQALIRRLILAAESGCIAWMPVVDEARAAIAPTPGRKTG
jgi:hypothetical protein